MRSPADPGSAAGSVGALLDAALAAAPADRPAVLQDDRVLTYGELADVPPAAPGAAPVLITAPRGIEAVVAMVRCLRAGRPFFPSPYEIAVPEGVSDGCGYLLTTSGTAGPAKTVLGSDRALARYLAWQRDELALTGADVLSNTADPWFDFSFKETLGALVAGACIAVAGPADLATGPALLRWLLRARPSVVCLLPSRLAALCAALEAAGRLPLDRLRLLLVSGEPFPAPLLARWRALAPDPVVLNLYGPTESTVIKLRQELPPGAVVDTPTVPVGRPIPGTAVELGPDGELLLVGDDLALGYLGPAEGSTRFAVDAAGRRVLHTGDLARIGADGAVELLGRADHVVKRHGVKVALPAVEAAAARTPGVDAAAAVQAADGRITLFCGAAGGVPTRAVRTALLGRLDPGQLPDRIRVLPALPLDPRGKVDRAALRHAAGKP